MRRSLASLVVAVSALPAAVCADPPSVSYIFPAGGERGRTVDVRVGGHNLHQSARFEMTGPGIEASPRIERTETVWFEGPVLPLPDSQRSEDYPRDYAGRVTIAADAPLGPRRWHITTSQGTTTSLPFIVGDLPEVVEAEVDGRPVPVRVELPVTINGRVFPREDVDVWEFAAKKGDVVTADVCAQRLGSPLEARLEIRGPDGRKIAETVSPTGGDPRASFTAPADGLYQVRIHDVSFGGLQNYVYRLTVSTGASVEAVYPLGGRRGETVELELIGAGVPKDAVAVAIPPDAPRDYRWDLAGSVSARPVFLETGDDPELREAEPNDEAGAAMAFSFPAVLNGRIERAGDVDCWTFDGTKGEKLVFDLKAARLGSPLDSVLTLLDAAGKTIATADDLPAGQTDSRLTAMLPADGRYTLQVADRLTSRGGSEFAYRLHARTDAAPDFSLMLPADAVTVERGGKGVLKIALERRGGFDGEVVLGVENLPSGVTAVEAKIGKNQSQAQLTLNAAADAPLGVAPVRIVGRGMMAGGAEIIRNAVFELPRGERPLEELRLAVAVPTPFRFTGLFESRYAPRGSVFVRHYQIERGDYDGPITVTLADKQARHLQGVTAVEPVVVPPGVSEFDFAIALPPWMDIGRTSRTCLMAVGEVVDSDGTRHTVSYTSAAQNDQMIILVDPGRLSVALRQPSVRAATNGEVQVAVEVGRGAGIEGAVTVEIVAADHVRGVESKAVTIPADQTTGTLAVRFAAGAGPFNGPLVVRARTRDERGFAVTAEAELTVVADE